MTSTMMDQEAYWERLDAKRTLASQCWKWRDEPFWKPIRGVPDDPFAGIGTSETAIRRRARKMGFRICKTQFRDPYNGPVGYFVFRPESPEILVARCRSLEHLGKWLAYRAR